LKKEDVYGYGGYSKVYKDNKNGTCIKVYREKIPESYRNVIKLNYLDLDKIKSLRDDPQFLTPLKLSTDRNGTLQAVEFPFLPYKNMWGLKRQSFMTPKYLTAIIDMTKIIKKLTNRGVVITDLKLSNMMVKEDNNIIITDNDFSIRIQNEDLLASVLEISKNVYLQNYLEKFSTTLDEKYNDYMLINMLALLLLETEDLNCFWPVNSQPTYKTLEGINRLIQTDRSISMSVKQNIKNNLTADTYPNVSQRAIDNYCDVVMNKIKRYSHY